MQLEQPVGSKPLIVRCGVGMFRLQKDKIDVNLTVPEKGQFCALYSDLRYELTIGPPQEFAPQHATGARNVRD